MNNWNSVEQALREATLDPEVPISERSPALDCVSPGAVLLVGKDGQVVFHKAFGCRSILPKVTPAHKNLVYDVASLTKAVVTTSICMRLVERGKLDLDHRVSRILQTFGSHGKEQITVRHLLAHCAGFPAHVPFFKKLNQLHKGERSGILQSPGAREIIVNEISRSRIDNAPGKVAVYTDLGFILLGAVIEAVCAGQSLEKIARQEVFDPLSLRSSGFVNLGSIKQIQVEPVCEEIAPTTDCPWRQKIIVGEVQDENAWAMGGVAGHAGLFSTAKDLHSFAKEMLCCSQGSGTFLGRDVVREFWGKDTAVRDSTWCLGWDSPSAQGSSAGRFFSPHSVGHLGYTGCALWIDPSRNLDVVLLTNRVHPSADNKRIKQFRPLIHDLVMEALGFGG